MSGDVIDIGVYLRAPAKTIIADLEEVHRQAGEVYPFSQPITDQKTLKELIGTEPEIRDPALLGLFDYHRKQVSAFVLRQGLEFKTMRIFEQSLANTHPVVHNDHPEERSSFMTMQHAKTAENKWRELAIVTLSDINYKALDIVAAYRRLRPRFRGKDDAAEGVMQSAFVSASYELFGQILNGAAYWANRYGEYKPGINIYNTFYNEGLETAIVTPRVRANNLCRSPLDHEAQRFITGFGRIGLIAELTRSGIADEELSHDIAHTIARTWRSAIPKNSAQSDVQSWLIGKAYPYDEDAIRETLRMFESIDQPPLSDESFMQLIARAFSKKSPKSVE